MRWEPLIPPALVAIVLIAALIERRWRRRR